MVVATIEAEVRSIKHIFDITFAELMRQVSPVGCKDKNDDDQDLPRW